MSMHAATPWHKASYDAFLNEWLPTLLAERLPLAGYAVTPVDPYTCCLCVTLTSHHGDVELVFDGLPQPDEEGVFKINGEEHVILPVAISEDLAQAEIRCVGEQLYAYVEARLGQSPQDLPWDVELARAWLPLETWVGDFMTGDNESAHVNSTRLAQTNWLARQTHLRRLLLPEREAVITPSQVGRVCPFETPEGPNIGRVLTIAVGAEIRDGKLVVVDGGPAAGLGLSASMIPFLAHNDPNRILMGANMMRQWIAQAQPEPALVQTGNEPEGVPFWHGRNLLTAFVAWGPGTFEDGIIVSESCSRRFDTPYPVQVGDKLSNRHGTKGVVSQVLPDAEMPHLEDGTPVDLIFNFVNLHRRMSIGEVREAVMGAVARRGGEPVIVPPFKAPDADDLRARLAGAGLCESGMVSLTSGEAGPPLELPSTVGWVYWGRLIHLAKDKLHTFVDGVWGQVQGEMENYILRDLRAFETLRENLSTRSVQRPDADKLYDRVAAGPVDQAEPPTPIFVDLTRRLRVAGIEAVLEGEALAFRFLPPQADSLKLARPIPHPWLRERVLTEIGMPVLSERAGDVDVWSLLAPPGGWYGTPSQLAAYSAVVEANERVARMLGNKTPQRLVDDAIAQLESRVQICFDSLLTPSHLRLSERLAFSGRTVLVPGLGLTLDQVGMPETMAWALFGPLVMRALGGDAAAVEARKTSAVEALDAVMARSWVIVNRAPTLAPTALLAFHPVRVAGDALQIHPLICEWLNADFDGDQAAVLLPITEAGQREAGEKLSVVAHLRRDPTLLTSLLPRQDALWGLASLSLQPGGLREIEALVGAPVGIPRGFVTHVDLGAALQDVLAREGVAAILVRLNRLMTRGFEVAKASGASLAPVLHAEALLSPAPPVDKTSAWETYVAEVAETLAAPVDCAPASLGPQCLMVRAAGQGLEQLAWLIAGRGVVEDAAGDTVVVDRGYVAGYTPEALFACVPGARRGLASILQQWEQMARTFRARNVSPSFNVITRALRAQHPGVVFARAAAVGEVDPLEDVEARLVVGLPVDG